MPERPSASRVRENRMHGLDGETDPPCGYRAPDYQCLSGDSTSSSGRKPVLDWIKNDLSDEQRAALGKAMQHTLQVLGVGVCATQFGKQLREGCASFACATTSPSYSTASRGASRRRRRGGRRRFCCASSSTPTATDLCCCSTATTRDPIRRRVASSGRSRRHAAPSGLPGRADGAGDLLCDINHSLRYGKRLRRPPRPD